jgi:hypothetical protein
MLGYKFYRGKITSFSGKKTKNNWKFELIEKFHLIKLMRQKINQGKSQNVIIRENRSNSLKQICSY